MNPSYVISIFATPLPLFIIAVMFGVLALILLVVFSDKLNLDRKIGSWPSTPGKITSSRFDKKVVHMGYGSSSRNATRYFPSIHYTFSVGGAQYHGETIGNGYYVGMTSGGPKRLVARFPAGATVPVYYNPANPTEAVIQKSLAYNLLGLVCGFVMAGMGFVFVGLWIWSWLAGR